MKYMKLFLTSTGLETKEIAERFVSFLAPVNPKNLYLDRIRETGLDKFKAG